MKSFISILSAFILALVHTGAMAQDQGAITYESRINLYRNIPKDQEAMKDMLPEYRTSRQILTFNEKESLYKPLVDEEDDMAMDATGGGTRMVLRTPQNETYMSTASSRKTSLRKFMGKNYIISDSITIQPWRFSDETKIIQGYTCKKASYTDEKRQQEIVAWYTEQLRPFLGPEAYASLPGTVLEVDVNNSQVITRATKVDLRNLKKNELYEPVKGQQVTEKEYQELVQEQMKKMGDGNGRIIIRN
ncbi:GLPGLI family protein [Pontibacter sp. SGAir0037]|uniref:GLPGLI family protein n=1 Tax=Pontibacter sp. SGAir0037 TaxID=2571030 RepID=UPI0010CCBD74|nr:GLPGLI family protein [Pontibacter sp. SGAir0037]QCR23062.1 GLPGLI family protein [Pontibacter sp. SGAir0037]